MKRKIYLKKILIYYRILYIKLDELINNLKQLFKEINQNKEELKLNIKNIFTKLRNANNEREEKLLIEVDNEYDKFFFNEDIMKKLKNCLKK